MYLTVLLVRGVSQVTQAPVKSPNRSRLAYLRVLEIRGVSKAIRVFLKSMRSLVQAFKVLEKAVRVPTVIVGELKEAVRV